MRFALLILFFVVAGCPRPVASAYRVLPSVRVSTPIAEAQPVAPTGEPALDRFLAQIAAAIDRHDWRGLASRFEGDAYVEQVALVGQNGHSVERTAEQVVAETVGLSTLFNYDRSDGDAFARLNAIRVVTLRTVETHDSDFFDVGGDVRLDDGASVPFAFKVRRDGTGFLIVVPQG